jgi:hypothetical protein
MRSSSAQQHGVADVADEELVQHQHPHRAPPFARDRHQRIAFAGVVAQALVDVAHETVEVRAALFREWQAGEEQIDQEGLAAPDPAPQVQAPWGRRRPVAEQPLEHAAGGHRRRSAAWTRSSASKAGCCAGSYCQSPRATPSA